MRKIFALVVGAVAVYTTVTTAADAPYIGKWKVNAAKSQMTGEAISIEKLSSGDMQYHYDVEGFAYNFNLDGKEYPLPDGGTTSWAAIDAKTWQVTNRRNGRISATYRIVLYGDTLVFESKRSKANGGTSDETAKAIRVSGGPGFVGRWKISAVTKPAVGTMEIAPNGTDGVTLTSSESGAVCKAKLDGKDYPLTGPFVGTGNTYAFKKMGSRSLEIVEKLNGKLMYTDNVSVSEDGKTLTFESLAAGSHDSARVIYDKQ